MLNNIKPYLTEDTNKRMETLLKNYTLIFQFKNTKRTGSLGGAKTYNELFLKTKGNYYTSIFQYLKNKESLEELTKHHKRVDKILKYYTTEQYKNIEQVYITGINPYPALLHSLALWVDHDLLKPYYKNIPIEKIDETLWAEAVHTIRTSHQMFSHDKELLKHKRFNIFRFLDLIESDLVPIIYKDGLLLPEYSTMLTDLTIYTQPTVKQTVKNITKKLTNPTLSNTDFVKRGWAILPWFVITRAFPYHFVLMTTDYGYTLNVYKFNTQTLDSDLILTKPIHREPIDPTIKGIKHPTTDFDTLEEDIYGYCFGIDEEYAYFYTLNKKLIKLPLDKIDCLEIQENKIKIKYEGKQKEVSLDRQLNITTVIKPCNNIKN